MRCLVAAVLSSVALGCAAGGFIPAEGGTSDAGPQSDAGAMDASARDAGDDAGGSRDAGMDAGAMRDGGSSRDASAVRDAGRDAGRLRDAGRDAGTMRDAGRDAGTMRDAGRDAGTMRDAGRDAGMGGTDAGGGGGVWPRGVLFVTATRVTGSGVGGLAGADAICRSEAAAAGLASAAAYVAVLSDSTVDAQSRFRVSGEIRMTNGVLVAASSADLWASFAMTQVNRTASRGMASWHLVWSGTQPSGVKHGTGPSSFCQNWTSDAGGVETGRSDRSGAGWIAIYYPGSPGNACSNPGLLYCIGPG